MGKSKRKNTALYTEMPKGFSDIRSTISASQK
jgi:hypothetical protein